METDDTAIITPDSTTVGVSTNGTGASYVNLIQQELNDLAEAKDVYIPVAGYEKSGLATKYRMPENGKELNAIAEKVEKANKDRFYRNLWTVTDTMIALCEGLYVKPEDVEEYVMLDPQESGEPVRYDGRLAELIGLPTDTRAREIVRKLFGHNDQAIFIHGEKLNRWLGNTQADLQAELWQLGN